VNSLNPTGFVHQQTLPLLEIEPLILKWWLLLLLAEMGKPLTRSGIIELEAEVTKDTVHSDR
jgi:hypothetical protein